MAALMAPWLLAVRGLEPRWADCGVSVTVMAGPLGTASSILP